MNRIIQLALLLAALAAAPTRLWSAPPTAATKTIEIPADVLEDKIRGGMLAQVLGNLNGLPHEFKYIDEPGNVEHCTPSLPKGARTDDDTDIEWVYLRAIARGKENFLPPAEIVALWKRHINRHIFAANRYARDLMDLGIEPPWTGNVALNPWSDFNISGQFLCESFGLMSPAMPQTAARLGVHYTHVTIDGEPAQATQLFTTMIATAFVEADINKILDAGMQAVDPKSKIAEVVTTVRQLCRDNPTDWKKTRLAIKNRWQLHGGIVRDRNGYELNTACVIAALIYGHGDFVETLRTAFNLGWDADCNGATAATIVGVIKGRRWMNEQGWNIKDVYANTTRDDMPMNETLTGLENLCIEAARITIAKNGGAFEPSPAGRGQGEGVCRIVTEQPANIEPLATAADQFARAKQEFLGASTTARVPGATPQNSTSRLAQDLTTPGVTRARAAYLAICLGQWEKLNAENPKAWFAAIADLQQNYPAVVHNAFKSPAPIGDPLRQAAEQAGLHDPKNLKLTERPLED